MNNRYNFSNVNVQVLNESAEDVFPSNERAHVWHDDGAMGIVYRGNNYVFYFGQDVSNRDYNNMANEILARVGIVGPRVSGQNN